MITKILNNFIDAHYTYQTTPFLVRQMVRMQVLISDLLRQVGNLKSPPRNAEKFVKCVVYVYGSLLLYDRIYKRKLLHFSKPYFSKKNFAERLGYISDSIYYFYDGFLLVKFFTAQPNLSPLHECIRGISQVTGSLGYFFNKTNLGDTSGLDKLQSFGKVIEKISMLSFCVEGLLQIAKSQMKNEVTMIQTCALTAGLTYSATMYVSGFIKRL